MLLACLENNEVISSNQYGYYYYYKLIQYGPTTLTSLWWSMNLAYLDFHMFEKVFFDIQVDKTMIGVLSNIAVKWISSWLNLCI